MNIIFHLKNGNQIEAHECSEKDLTRLVSQFNNRHLMRVENVCINPKEVVYLAGYGSEDNQ